MIHTIRVGRGLAATATVAAVTAAALIAPVSAEASSIIKCTASASPSRPARYSHVHIVVHTKAAAYVHATAHYKTTNTSHAKHAGSKGVADLDFYISGATAGRRVPVSVTAKGPHHTASCSTGFTPH